jgi:hypothetical protein
MSWFVCFFEAELEFPKLDFLFVLGVSEIVVVVVKTGTFDFSLETFNESVGSGVIAFAISCICSRLKMGSLELLAFGF